MKEHKATFRTQLKRTDRSENTRYTATDKKPQNITLTVETKEKPDFKKRNSKRKRRRSEREDTQTTSSFKEKRS